MLTDGTIVKDFIDIPFTTSTIYLVDSTNPEELFSGFKNLVKSYEEECRKKGLVGKLRNKFRK